MGKWSRWLSTPRGLLIMFGTVVALPALTLVFLGLRLLQQDRDLAAQQRTRSLEDAADRVVRAIDADLKALEASLADPAWAPREGAAAVRVVITPAGVSVDPPNALAYFPIVPAGAEVPDEPFRDLERAELQPERLSLALHISRGLATSPDPSMRAGALLRQARILRKLGRSREALSVYSELAAFDTLSINGLPADLQARKTQCVLLQEGSRASDLRREAAAIAADLESGRWRLDRANYLYVTSLLDTWLVRGPEGATEREASAAAVDWLYHAEGRPTSGVRVIEPDDASVMLVWASAGTRLTALVGGPAYIRAEWLARAQRAASPAEISLLPPTELRGVSPTPGSRSAAVTGLPWSLVVSLPADHEAGQLESRRRTLLLALTAVFVLVGAGSYLIVRARTREMALARLQSDFVAAVSHEFRTPLTALRQFNALLDDDGELPAETKRTYHAAQTRATERLHQLVESLLDFGRMEAGKRQYSLERLDAGLLVRDVVEEFQQEHERDGTVLRCTIGEDDHAVDADPEALARALWNLLDNAVKYSGNGQDVDVTVSRHHNRIAIAVRDRGIGIPAAEQGRIFEKFSRGSAATARRINGTGIGLAMVQHIAQAHGGAVGVESAEGSGSTFTISLPAIPTIEPRTQTAAHTNTGTHAT